MNLRDRIADLLRHADIDDFGTLAEAEREAKINDLIPKSGSWHIERRLIRPWRDVTGRGDTE